MFDLLLASYMDENYCITADVVFSKLGERTRKLIKLHRSRAIKYNG